MMQRQTRNWLLFALGWYIMMFILIPPKRGSKLSPFGFWLGFVQAVILNWITVRNHKLWRLPGDILLSGIPILTSLAWIPPSIIFANFFPTAKSWFWKATYILFFAAGTTIIQYGQKCLGMWENIKWKDLYTFPLAVLTHTLMAITLPFFKIK
ncbi:MAG: hypothetical protein AB1796_03605 [Bacillota bacterium]